MTIRIRRDRTGEYDGRYLRLNASNDPLTGTLDSQNIFPSADATYDLGSGSFRWARIFARGVLSEARVLGDRSLYKGDYILTDSGLDLGTTYRNLNLTHQYTTNDAGALASPNIIPIDISVTTSQTAGLLAPTISFMRARYTSHVNALLGTGNLPIDIGITLQGTSLYAPAYLFSLTHASTSENISLRSYVSTSSSGRSLGYQGYAQGTGTSTAELVGVEGYIAQVSTTARIKALSARPSAIGTGVANSKIMSLYGTKGHILIDQGSLFVRKTATADPSAFSSTRLTHTNFDGDIYAEGQLEVDGKAWFDNGAEIASQKHLRIGVFSDANRGAAGTNGRIIFNTTDNNLNIDNGTNWILPDGTVT